MNGRRSSIEVIGDILRMERASRTNIMYRVGMSYSQLCKYLDYLVAREFLSWSGDGYPGGVYHTTSRGRALLKSIEAIEEFLYSDDPGPVRPQPSPATTHRHRPASMPPVPVGAR